MFERYTETARRIISRARQAALDAGASAIEPIHMLAAIRQEAPHLFETVNLGPAAICLPSLPRESRLAEPPAGVMPFGKKSKQALYRAAEACERFHHEVVGPEDLLWGVLRADKGLRKQLERGGLTEEKLRAVCRIHPEAPDQTVESTPSTNTTSPAGTRSGIGYDLHRLEPGRRLILGGVEVPFDRGPVGHSDGDVLSHAICDALLGAAGLGDIGTHFPDSDPRWKGASSLVFLEQTHTLLERRSLRIAHIDAVVIAERPKLGPHFPAMKDALAKALGIEAHQINLKAKTNEGIGELGRGEAIAAHAIATLEG